MKKLKQSVRLQEIEELARNAAFAALIAQEPPEVQAMFLEELAKIAPQEAASLATMTTTATMTEATASAPPHSQQASSKVRKDIPATSDIEVGEE